MGFSEVQRQAIFSDPKWRGGDYPEADPPVQGLSLARQIAMLTYRSHASFAERFMEPEASNVAPALVPTFPPGGKTLKPDPSHEEPGVIGYLHAQGQKLVERRFDARTYVCLINLLGTFSSIWNWPKIHTSFDDWQWSVADPYWVFAVFDFAIV